jgi:oxygen-independent coproporphyrinogen-3 oxidase
MPYCPYKCHYCDFNAYRLPPRPGVLAEMAEGIAEEIRRAGGEDRGREVGSIYFGGGTPSLFPPDRIAALIDLVRRRYEVRRGAEVTLECNPGTVDLGSLRALRRAGVTRLSLGAQSFSQETLRRLGRGHSPDDTRRAVQLAR